MHSSSNSFHYLLALWALPPLKNSKRNILSGALYTARWKKICEIAVYVGNGRDRPIWITQIFGIFYMRAHSVRNNIQILYGKLVIKLDVRKIFTRSTTNADARSVCGNFEFYMFICSWARLSALTHSIRRLWDFQIGAISIGQTRDLR